MRKEYRIRYTITGIVFTVIMALLVVRLFNLQFVQGEKNLEKAQEFSRKDMRLTGPRGKILDRDGLPLAYNKTSYSVQFVRDPTQTDEKARANYTKGMMLAMQIIEGNGAKFISTFAISRMPDGSYDFYWPGIDKVEDAKVYKARVDKWKSENCRGDIKSKDSPEQIFAECRKYYGVPEDASYEDAYKVLSVWQEVRATYYASYLPVTLAQNVDMQTVAKIETSLIDLPGVKINQSSARVYPNKSMAAHIIGYMGRMLDEPTIVDMQSHGYKRDDLIGVSGIEKTQELELSGNTTERTGTKVVEVNNLGGVVREIESDNKSPIPGNNVMLTIDSGMQKRLEELLAENIAQCRAQQETSYRDNPDKYNDELAKRKGNNNNNVSLGELVNYASVGAAVVMDVQTGEVLAMASYPSYDLNMFTGGLSIEDSNKLNAASANNPQFDNAISSRGTPGSVFKMCTGLAGLMEGAITLDTKIDDLHEYRQHLANSPDEKGPTCWDPYPAQHKAQNLELAIKNSCNYFFFSVADKMGISKLNKWADLLGLTSKTNVELPNEIAGQVGSQKALYSSTVVNGVVTTNMSGVAALVRNQIVKLMKDVGTKRGYVITDDKYTDVALQMMDLVNQKIANKGSDIRAILKNELKFTSADFLSTVPSLDSAISMSLTEITWRPGLTIEAGIGQSVTLLTPLGMARYVSALVNGGNVYEATLIKSIITPDGQARSTPPKLIRNLGVDTKYLEAIKIGMKDVVSPEEGGTAGDYFTDFEAKYGKNMIGGKTGTAQVNANIDLENNSWFVAFAPFEKPEIAVVVYIPHGYKGAFSSYTAKMITEYYLDKKKLVNTQAEIPQVNSLVQ